MIAAPFLTTLLAVAPLDPVPGAEANVGTPLAWSPGDSTAGAYPRILGEANPQDPEKVEGIEWFEGDFEALVAAATESGRGIYLHFEASYNSQSQFIRTNILARPEVASGLSKYLCHSVEITAEPGRTLGQRFGVVSLPMAVILDGKGEPLDAILGFKQAEELAVELERIARGEDTLPTLRARVEAAPEDLMARYRLAKKFQQVGMATESTRAIATLRELDPESKSLALKTLRIDELITAIDQGSDAEALRAYLDEIEVPGLLFRGWMRVGTWHSSITDLAHRSKKWERARKYAPGFVSAWRRAWTHCPDEERGMYGDYLSKRIYAYRNYLPQDDLNFGAAVASDCFALDPGNIDWIDTMACCLYGAGDPEGALAMIAEGERLDPSNILWAARRKEFSK